MASQYEDEKDGNFPEQKGFNGMQMVQFECPRHWKPSVSCTFGVAWILFSHYWPSGVIRIDLPSMKVKKMEIFHKKRGFNCCKWSSLNVTSTKVSILSQILHPINMGWDCTCAQIQTAFRAATVCCDSVALVVRKFAREIQQPFIC